MVVDTIFWTLVVLFATLLLIFALWVIQTITDARSELNALKSTIEKDLRLTRWAKELSYAEIKRIGRKIDSMEDTIKELKSKIK